MLAQPGFQCEQQPDLGPASGTQTAEATVQQLVQIVLLHHTPDGEAYRNFGTFQNRAKVVDSWPGYTAGMAGCRPNLTTRAKRSMRLSISTEGTIRLLQRPFVGARSLQCL